MIGGGTASLLPKPMWDLGLSVGKVWVAGVAKQYMIMWRNDWIAALPLCRRSHCVESLTVKKVSLCRKGHCVEGITVEGVTV